MLKLSEVRSSNFSYDQPEGDEGCCVVCGRAVDKMEQGVWLHEGGTTIVTHEEGKELNREGHDYADVGCHPVGPACARKNKDKLADYLIDFD